MTLHKVTEFYRKLYNVCPNITSKSRTIAIFKSFFKENNVSNTILGTSTIFQCTKLHLSKFSEWWVVSTKQNVNFNIQPAAILVHLFFIKTVFSEVVFHLKLCEHSGCYGPNFIRYIF